MHAKDIVYNVMYNEYEKARNDSESDDNVTGGNVYMDDFLQRYKKQSFEQGIEQGIERGAITNARKLIENGKLSFDEIAQCSGLTLEKVKELAQTVCTLC